MNGSGIVPFYGRIIRFADFYPVADGIEQSVGRLEGLVRQGYSIVVFPEGTRSEDCSIRRFHRGAFYLAEQLKLDIIPVVFHGIGHVLPKAELLLRKGSVTVKVLPRITPDDRSFGENYAERTRAVPETFCPGIRGYSGTDRNCPVFPECSEGELYL